MNNLFKNVAVRNISLKSLLFKSTWTTKIILFLVCFFVIDRFLMSETFCYAEMRVIPDEEFIQMALKIEGKAVKYGPQDTMTNYHQNHPDCCTVGRNYPRINNDFFSGALVGVVMKFEGSEPQNDGAHFVHVSLIRFNSCGSSWDRTGE